MGYLQVFINAVVVALMAMYVYENERKMEKMSTKHYQTERELDVLKMVSKSKEDQTKAETEKLVQIENQLNAGTRKLADVENQLLKSNEKEKEQLISTKADTEKLSVIEHQQIEGIRKLTEIEHQLLKSKEKGVTYIRWGKTQCDGSNTETLYSGQAGGSQYSQPGSSVNYLCLPLNPDGALPLKAHSWYAFLCGAEYQVNEGNTPQGIRSDIFNHDVACAACLAKGKLSSIMIPGWKTCNNGWTKEYDGILMAGHPIHAASSEYACVDKVTETIAGGSRDENGILFYPVKTVCGSLKCPPYKPDTDVPCVVCSK